MLAVSARGGNNRGRSFHATGAYAMLRFRAVHSSIAVLFVAYAAGSCMASTLIGVSPSGGRPFVVVDYKTGATLPFGGPSAISIRDITSWPGEPRSIWAIGLGQISNVDAPTGTLLYSATLPETLASIAIDPTDGQIYGHSTTYNIYRFARGSTDLTLIGSMGVSTGEFHLTFDAVGQLFAAAGSTLYSVSKSTAALTSLGTMPGVSGTSRFDFAFRPEDGKLYALGNTTQSYRLFTIDPLNGSTAMIGPSIIRPSGLAFLAIPEPSSLALFCLGSLCLIRRI